MTDTSGSSGAIAPSANSEVEVSDVSIGVSTANEEVAAAPAAQPSASGAIGGKRAKANLERSFLEKVRDARFLCIRALSCPVPGLSSKHVPLIGGRTGLEVIVCLVVAAAVIAFSVAGDAGSVLAATMFAVAILGMRTNVLDILFGVSFERALYYHKWFGGLMLAVMAIHIGQKGFSGSGVVLLITTVVIAAVYLGKNTSFELFYYVHIAAYLATAIVLLFHGGSLGTVSLIPYAVDLSLRYLIRGRKVSAEVEKLPGDVVRISFPRDFEHEAGGYMFVRIPELSQLEYHPFSISSSPLEKTVTLHVRALGDWSSRLLQLAERHQQEVAAAGGGAKLSKTMEVYLEGPFGCSSVDFSDEEYKVFLLISGGIGVTPMQSIYNTLALEHEAGRKLRKVIFVWSVKDKVMMGVDNTRIRRDKSSEAENGDDEGLIADLPASFQPSKIYRIASSELVVDSLHPHDIQSPSIFHAEFYLTQVKNKEALLEAGIAEDTPDRQLCFGRPDIPKLFESARELCRASGIKRVAVGVCGPPAMVNEVNDLCRESKLACDSNAIRFDCHKEVFDF